MLHQDVEIDAAHQCVDVYLPHEAVDIDLLEQLVHIDALQDRIQVDPLEKRIEVERLENEVDHLPSDQLRQAFGCASDSLRRYHLYRYHLSVRSTAGAAKVTTRSGADVIARLPEAARSTGASSISTEGAHRAERSYQSPLESPALR